MAQLYLCSRCSVQVRDSVGNSASPGKGKPVLLDPQSSEQAWVPWAEDTVGQELPCPMALCMPASSRGHTNVNAAFHR